MEIKITMPDHQREIKLSQYQKFVDVLKTNENDAQSETFISLKMLDIFCGVPLKETMKFRFKDVQKVASQITGVINQEVDFVQKFKMNGIEFGFIPNLEDMSFGEFIDIENNITDWSNIDKAMAVLYRPIVNTVSRRYTIEEYEPNKYDMTQMPLDAVNSAVVFFYRLGSDLLTGMVKYLEEEKEKATADQRSLTQNGDGITQSMQSLKEMLNDLKVSLN